MRPLQAEKKGTIIFWENGREADAAIKECKNPGYLHAPIPPREPPPPLLPIREKLPKNVPVSFVTIQHLCPRSVISFVDLLPAFVAGFFMRSWQE
jgi:hypothetical protein